MNNVSTKLPLILIAEDNESNYLLLEFLLKHTYSIIHAHNGGEAIELFTIYQPQLILMDIKMPETNGYEATLAIRQLSKNIPIIAVTAYAFSEDEEKIMESGFNAYIAKPINSEKLKELIRKLLKREKN